MVQIFNSINTDIGMKSTTEHPPLSKTFYFIGGEGKNDIQKYC